MAEKIGHSVPYGSAVILCAPLQGVKQTTVAFVYVSALVGLRRRLRALAHSREQEAVGSRPDRAPFCLGDPCAALHRYHYCVRCSQRVWMRQAQAQLQGFSVHLACLLQTRASRYWPGGCGFRLEFFVLADEVCVHQPAFVLSAVDVLEALDAADSATVGLDGGFLVQRPAPAERTRELWELWELQCLES